MFEMNKDYVFKKDLYWEDMSRFFVKASDWSEEVDGMPVIVVKGIGYVGPRNYIVHSGWCEEVQNG